MTIRRYEKRHGKTETMRVINSVHQLPRMAQALIYRLIRDDEFHEMVGGILSAPEEDFPLSIVNLATPSQQRPLTEEEIEWGKAAYRKYMKRDRAKDGERTTVRFEVTDERKTP